MFERGQNIVENRRGGRSAPTTVNSSVRTREYLTRAEIERLMAAARKSSRYGHRDATMILIGYRHGLRASELCDLQWSQVELTTGRLHVRRAKNGSPSVHPMQGDEIRALRRLQREQGGILARLYDRAGRADDAQSIPCAIRPDRRAGQNAVPSPPSHVEARLRLRAGHRPRHQSAAGMARAQEHSAHRALHRAGAGQVQKLLALGSRSPLIVYDPLFPRGPRVGIAHPVHRWEPPPGAALSCDFRTIQVCPKDTVAFGGHTRAVNRPTPFIDALRPEGERS